MDVRRACVTRRGKPEVSVDAGHFFYFFEYWRGYTRAMDVPSAMPTRSLVSGSLRQRLQVHDAVAEHIEDRASDLFHC